MARVRAMMAGILGRLANSRLAKGHRWLLSPDRSQCQCCTAFDDLVQLTPIQPDAPALRAIINFDPLPVAHNQI